MLNGSAHYHSPAKALSDALKGSGSGGKYMARCPAHDDRTASLSIGEGKDGQLLLNCLAGCEYATVREMLEQGGHLPQAKIRAEPQAIYTYVDEFDKPLLEVVRRPGKQFHQRLPGGVKGPVKGVRVVPYRLPEALETIAMARPVFIVEGEKDADDLAKLGIAATCNAGGTGMGWRREHSRCLQGADAIVIPDNDESGRAHAEKVAKSLTEAGAVRVRVLALPGLKEKGDVSDWLAAGGTAEKLWALAEAAPDWLADAGDGWPAPDPSIAQKSQFTAPTMPLEGFGPVLSEWIKKTAEAKNAAIDYVGLALLAGASGVIGVRRFVGPWGDRSWEEPAMVWAALVGPPSANKSPSVDAVRDAIIAAEIKKAENFADALADYELRSATAKAANKAWDKAMAKAIEDSKPVPVKPTEAIEPVPPIRPRLYVVDSTTEKLGRIMAAQPGGLVCICDELAGLIGGFDRYGGSGADRTFWIMAYGGRPHRIDRVSIADGSIDIAYTAASVVGSIQPDRLNSLVLSGDNDGFAARFLFAWPEPVVKRRPTCLPDRELVKWAFIRLSALPVDWEFGPPCLPFAPDAVEIFQQWYEGKNTDDTNAASGMLAEAFGKLNGGLARIALNFELLRWAVLKEPIDRAPAPDHVSRRSVEDAMRFIEQWVKPMLRRVLAEASIPGADRNAATLARWIMQERPEKFNARTLRHTKRAALPGIKEAADMDDACTALCDIGWLRKAGERAGGTKGRSSKSYEVNPAIFTAAFRANVDLPPRSDSSVSSDSPPGAPNGANGANGARG